MKLLTTKKEREIVMKPLREVSKTEKIIFPIAVTVFVALLVPSATPLVGCLMLGNLWKESGVAERLCKTAQNELMNIVTIFLGISSILSRRVSFHACLATSRRTLYFRCCTFVSNFLIKTPHKYCEKNIKKPAKIAKKDWHYRK